jgi:hypothetical protein
MLKILVVDGFRTGITFPIRLRLYLSTALLTPERLPSTKACGPEAGLLHNPDQ